ncbi:MAG: NADAR family protein [Verrucomicrobiota bacterium]
MKTDLTITCDELLSAMQKGFRPKWAFFWGHTPSQDGSITKSCFSQWWDGHPFAIDGITYTTAEHYMMAEKARLFRDKATLAEIIAAKSPAIAKKLGRQVTNFDENLWLRHRWDIVVRGNAAKFAQHAELKTFLLQTGDRILVEASPFDRIWGIGMSATHPDAERPQNWKGLNLLGFALMEVRQQLQGSSP